MILSVNWKVSVPVTNDRGCSRSPSSATSEPVTATAKARSKGPTARGLCAKVQDSDLGMHTLALVDQAIVSGTSFLSTVLVGRWTAPSELGIYAVVLSLLITLLCFQESLLSLPYTIQRQKPVRSPEEHAGGTLAMNGLLSAAAVIILLFTALIASASDTEGPLKATLWILTAIAPWVLLREFARTYSFAHLNVTQALIVDASVAAIQLTALGWLGWTGRMSAANACMVLGGACAVTGIVWLYTARAQFVIRAPRQVWEVARQSWGLGKWLFAAQITYSIQRYATYWLLPFVIGIEATGIFAACMSVALLANPVVLALANIRTARAVLALQEGGGTRLRRQVLGDSLLLALALSLFCAVIVFAGEQIMLILFHAEYEGTGPILTIIATAFLINAVGAPPSTALTSMERPRAVFLTGLLGATLTVVLVWFWAQQWGLIGAAYGFLAGNAGASAVRWIAFLALFSQANRLPTQASTAELVAEPRPATADANRRDQWSRS
jgi:O-antigen/teichoic acid export membrane protein